MDLDRPKRTRTSFTAEQLYRLEMEFQRCQYVVGRERTELARQLNLSETQVPAARLPAAPGLLSPPALHPALPRCLPCFGQNLPERWGETEWMGMKVLGSSFFLKLPFPVLTLKSSVV